MRNTSTVRAELVKKMRNSLDALWIVFHNRPSKPSLMLGVWLWNWMAFKRFVEAVMTSLESLFCVATEANGMLSKPLDDVTKQNVYLPSTLNFLFQMV